MNCDILISLLFSSIIKYGGVLAGGYPLGDYTTRCLIYGTQKKGSIRKVIYNVINYKLFTFCNAPIDA
jgi:hypothetical protein